MQSIPYGNDPSQYAQLHLPDTSANRLPVVVVVHGGYWRKAYGLELGDPLARDLVGHGVAAWNIEFRRLGNGGGWPATFEDAAAAIDALAADGQRAAGGRLSLDRVVVLGHSAGGHLAAWLSARHRLPAGAPGADPVVRPAGYVSQAGVVDLVSGYSAGLGSGAIGLLMGGGPDEHPDRYDVGSPYERLPFGVPGVLVHGLDDDVVPVEQSDRFTAQAGSLGDAVTELRLPGVEHFALIDPRTAAWTHCRDATLRLLGVG
jgi:acetyl esterase/lipase